jgi:hypothetical protein
MQKIKLPFLSIFSWPVMVLLIIVIADFSIKAIPGIPLNLHPDLLLIPFKTLLIVYLILTLFDALFGQHNAILLCLKTEKNDLKLSATWKATLAKNSIIFLQ